MNTYDIKIQQLEKVATKKLTFKGETKVFDVYKVPIDMLFYNDLQTHSPSPETAATPNAAPRPPKTPHPTPSWNRSANRRSSPRSRTSPTADLLDNCPVHCSCVQQFDL